MLWQAYTNYIITWISSQKNSRFFPCRGVRQTASNKYIYTRHGYLHQKHAGYSAVQRVCEPHGALTLEFFGILWCKGRGWRCFGRLLPARLPWVWCLFFLPGRGSIKPCYKPNHSSHQLSPQDARSCNQVHIIFRIERYGWE